MTMAQRLAAKVRAKQDAAKAAGILTASTNQELRAEINMLLGNQAVAAHLNPKPYTLNPKPLTLNP
jgi:hypothetical protein